MSAGHPFPQPTVRPKPARPGRLLMWKLTEPVRLYLWPALFAMLLAVIAVEFSSVELVVKVAAGSAWVALVSAVEAARASTYSQRGVMAERIDAATRARLGR